MSDKETEVVYHETPCNWEFLKNEFETYIQTSCVSNEENYICFDPTEISDIKDKNRNVVINSGSFLDPFDTDSSIDEDAREIVNNFKNKDDLLKKINELVDKYSAYKGLLIERVNYCPSCGKKVKVNWNE